MFLPLEAKNDPEFYLVAYLSAIAARPLWIAPFGLPLIWF
jgi:hypothetical protein